MAHYYLTIKKRNNFKLLDITNMEGFTRLSRFKASIYSLQELDNFTSQFSSEAELKRALLDAKLIDVKDLTDPIAIATYWHGKVSLIEHYEPVYKSSKSYIDLGNLHLKINELKNNRAFLEALVSKYTYTYGNEYIFQIRELLKHYNPELNLDDAVNNFYIYQVYQINKEGKTVIRYKNLRDLGLFTYAYVSTKGFTVPNTETKENLRQELISLKDEFTSSKGESHKVRVKKPDKNYILDGQISFFDND